MNRNFLIALGTGFILVSALMETTLAIEPAVESSNLPVEPATRRGDAPIPFPIEQPIPVRRSLDSEPVATPVAVQRTSPRRSLDRLHAGLLRKDLKRHGATSCSAASCHGGPRPGVKVEQARRGAEYQLWFENDPHARSWATLCSPQSEEMMRQLGILQEGKIVDPAAYDNCLACHNTTTHYDQPGLAADRLREGVGCASCHGPDERWRGTHYRRDWMPAAAEGFVNTKDLFVRARMCAACHVGDQDRDMNHDIIAAGHPPLRYEFATYHARLPKHWREADNAADFESKLWLAGQIAAADANLALLQARVSKSHSVSTWPEFAHYECSSCHHSLGLERTAESKRGRPPGTPKYSPWNTAGMHWLLKGTPTSDHSAALVAALKNLERMLETSFPADEAVGWSAQKCRDDLAQWFDSGSGIAQREHMNPQRLGQIVAAVAGKRDTFATWESATQWYLASVAARQAWPGAMNGPVANDAILMKHGLKYAASLDASIYGRKSYDHPVTNSNDIRDLGIGLAASLGPVSLEPPIAASGSTLEELRAQLRQMILELNRKWQNAAETPSPLRPRD